MILARDFDVPGTVLTAQEAALLWSFAAESSDATAAGVRAAVGTAASMALVQATDIPAEQVLAAIGAQPDSPHVGRLRQGLARWRARLNGVCAQQELDRAAAAGIEFYCAQDPQWPTGLAALGAEAPCGLWVRGTGDLQNLGSSLAVVGSRAATTYGVQVATDWSFEWASAGVAVVSGAAFGIDAAAHRGALAAGGVTAAVLACGVDVAYPSAHQSLLAQICDQGVVVSEYPPGQRVARHRFLQRNRLLAALTGATVVVEAAGRSGALSTAGWAARIGRPLGAVPGSVTSGQSVGPHRVLREFGGTVVANPAHGLELLGVGGPSDDTSKVVKPRDLLAEAEVLVAEALPSRGGLSTAEVAVAAGIDISQAESILPRLQVMGFATQVGDCPLTVQWRAG